MTRRINILVTGRSSYEKWSIYQWLQSFRSLLELKYGVEVAVESIETSGESVEIKIDGEVITDPPFEEGYLLEIVDSVVYRIICRDNDFERCSLGSQAT